MPIHNRKLTKVEINDNFIAGSCRADASPPFLQLHEIPTLFYDNFLRVFYLDHNRSRMVFKNEIRWALERTV